MNQTVMATISDELAQIVEAASTEALHQTRCPLCGESGLLKTIPCGHMICPSCEIRLVPYINDQIHCPFCLTLSTLPPGGFPTSFGLGVLDRWNQLQRYKCHHCPKRGLSSEVVRCFDCPNGFLFPILCFDCALSTHCGHQMKLLSTIFNEERNRPKRTLKDLPYGLLTRILVSLPLKEIVHNHRVCHHWNDVISLMPKIDAEQMAKLFDEQQGDFTIICDGEELKVHKWVLEKGSPVFATMLNTDMKEAQTNRLNIEDCSYQTAKDMLRFLYSGEFLADTDATELLIAAHRYDIRALKLLCTKRMEESLNMDNACQFFKLATIYDIPSVKSAAYKLLSADNEAAKATDGWKIYFDGDYELMKEMYEMAIKKLTIEN